jgi:hypothetical protein
MRVLVVMLAVGSLAAWQATGAPAAEPPRPNILFIFTDDHAAHALSCYGSKVNRTPHLDRLAAGGARFTNSFVTNSICSPSRATLLTGQYSHKNGVPVFNMFDGSRDTVSPFVPLLTSVTGLAMVVVGTLIAGAAEPRVTNAVESYNRWLWDALALPRALRTPHPAPPATGLAPWSAPP